MSQRLLPPLAGLILALACSSPGLAPPSTAIPPRAGMTGALEANWKERLAQPYVFVEHQGDYRDLGEAMRSVLGAARAQGLEPAGPPFALFYDDPGAVAADQLRARACLPVQARPERLGTLTYDELPRAMVVYARVPGPYPEVPRSYPALFTYLEGLGWAPGGPIREVYLVDPGAVSSYDELLTEVQIPWGRVP